MAVEISTKDERTIQVPVPADQEATSIFADFLSDAASDGYVIKTASDVEGGSQRDRYVVGLRITMERKP